MNQMNEQVFHLLFSKQHLRNRQRGAQHQDWWETRSPEDLLQSINPHIGTSR